MGRKRVSRTLDQLPNDRVARSQRDHVTDRLIEILRGVALQNQREAAQPFYSVREVASHFGVPLSTVAASYRRLEQEGLLNRVRSSRTVLQGRTYDRRLSVRGVIGFPASLSFFLTIQDYRMFFMRIRRELRLRHFATAMAFFEDTADEVEALTDRLSAYDVDTVIWFRPPPRVKPALVRLRDKGIRVLGFNDDTRTDLGARFIVDRKSAIEQIALEWKKNLGIKCVAIAESDRHRSPENDAYFISALRSHGIRFHFVSLRDDRVDLMIRTLLKARSDAVAFTSCKLASMVGYRAPVATAQLLCRRRVLFVGGPVNLPFSAPPEVPIDLITANWDTIARRIADELISHDAFTGQKTVFQAEHYIGVKLKDFAQQIHP